VAIAIDDRSVQREAVLSKSSSRETDSIKVDSDDGTKQRVKRTLGISKVSKPTGEEATRDASNFASSVFDSCILSQLNTYMSLPFRPRKTLIPISKS
jgi:hypothetical protein